MGPLVPSVSALDDYAHGFQKPGWINSHLHSFVAYVQQSSGSSLVAGTRHRTRIMSTVPLRQPDPKATKL